MALLRISLLKLVRRPATWVVFAILAAILVLCLPRPRRPRPARPSRWARSCRSELLLRFPTAYTMVVGFILGFGGLLAVAYGAAVIGADWAWGTIRAIVARGESRVRYTLVTFAAIAIVLLAGRDRHLPHRRRRGGGGGDDRRASARTEPRTRTRSRPCRSCWPGPGWAWSRPAAIGFAIAMLFKSQLAGIGAGLALYFAEIFLALVPHARRRPAYFPFSVVERCHRHHRRARRGRLRDAVSTLDATRPCCGRSATSSWPWRWHRWPLRRAQITQ